MFINPITRFHNIFFHKFPSQLKETNSLKKLHLIKLNCRLNPALSMDKLVALDIYFSDAPIERFFIGFYLTACVLAKEGSYQDVIFTK